MDRQEARTRAGKRPYKTPELKEFGAVGRLTRFVANGKGKKDNNVAPQFKNPS